LTTPPDAGIPAEPARATTPAGDPSLAAAPQRTEVERVGYWIQNCSAQRAHLAQGTCPRPGAHLAAPHRLMTDLVRVAAVGDLHCTKTSEGTLQALFAEMLECADVIALAGDLVDYGLAEEAHVLARELGVALKVKVPVVAVLGNHDYEDGHPE